MHYKKTFIIFIFSFIFLNLTLVFATNMNNCNYNKFFRIHVIANSDSIDDQLLKYTVAKQINEYIASITKNTTSKEETKKIIQENIYEILNIAGSIIQKNNLNYDVKARIGKMQYDKKEKDNMQMNKGMYDSLKIIIGDGKGQNWWSLIYPTTTTDVSIQNALETEKTTFSFRIIDSIKEFLNL